MSKEFASIPEPNLNLESLLGSVGALKQTVEALMGVRGTDDSTAVTASRLVEELSDFRPVFGEWTPGLRAFNPGDLSVVYGSQFGRYIRLGQYVFIMFNVSTSTWTFTTASSQLTVTGAPFPSDHDYVGSLIFSGITKAGYTQFAPVTADVATTNNTDLAIETSGSGVGISSVQMSNTTSGVNVVLRGTLLYRIAPGY